MKYQLFLYFFFFGSLNLAMSLNKNYYLILPSNYYNYKISVNLCRKGKGDESEPTFGIFYVANSQL